MNVDYIIIGQGLAGSAVAIQLLKLGKKILVFDDPNANHSSRIAAGLFNPITGRRMSKTWMADTIFPYLQEFYASAEKLLGANFFHPTPIYRPFFSIEEQNEWVLRSQEDEYKPFIRRVELTSIDRTLKDPHGGLVLNQSGYVNTSTYIDAVRSHIRLNGTLVNEIFLPERILFDTNGVSYKQYSASKVIWCTGIDSQSYFNWLPVRPLKGETIQIKADLPDDVIINRGVYIVPDDRKGNWKVGATYQFRDSSFAITKEGRVELEEKLKNVIQTPFEVIDQQWGFRPTTPDRRPLLGRHPDHPHLIVFNGLGTKGVSLAPYFSEVLVHWLEKGGSLQKEVDIERFKSVYSGSPKYYGAS